MKKNTKNNAAVKTKDIAVNNTPITPDPVPEYMPNVAELVQELSTPKTIEELWLRVDERLSAIEAKLIVKIKEGNGRGPLSTRSMTVDDAKRIMTGDLKDANIKTAAQTLGLSYGQVYSARNGYTFKEQYTEGITASKKK
jgi:hypothetical protein